LPAYYAVPPTTAARSNGLLLINILFLPVVVAVSRRATRVRRQLYPSPDRRYHMV